MIAFLQFLTSAYFLQKRSTKNKNIAIGCRYYYIPKNYYPLMFQHNDNIIEISIERSLPLKYNILFIVVLQTSIKFCS